MSKPRPPALCKGRDGQPGCGLPIKWVKNAKTLRMMPIDPDPTRDGNLVLDGNVATLLSPERARVYEGSTYISHFATCKYASSFRNQKPHAAPARPSDIVLGAFDSPAAAAVGRIEADALDITVDRLTDEFVKHAHAILGARPLEDELQHTWKAWQRAKKNMGVDPDTLLLVAKRARQQLNPAEVTAA